MRPNSRATKKLGTYDEEGVYYPFNAAVEHSKKLYVDRVRTLVWNVQLAFDRRPDGFIEVSTDKLEKLNRRLETSLLGERTWTSSEEMLIYRIEDILLDEETTYNTPEKLSKAVYQLMTNTSDDEMRSETHTVHLEKTHTVIIDFINKIRGRKISREDLDILRDEIIYVAVGVIAIGTPGHRGMDKVVQVLNDIDRELIRRRRGDGQWTIPRRIEPPRAVTEDEFKKENLAGLDTFIENTVKDTGSFETVFDLYMRERYERIDMSSSEINTFRAQMVQRLQDPKTSLDIIMGFAGLARNLFLAHCRKKGVAYGRGPGVWIGEKTLRYLIRNADRPVTQEALDGLAEIRPDLRRRLPPLLTRMSGREFFALILLEEAQHMFAGPVGHARLEERDDFGNYIEHSEIFLTTFTIIGDYSESPEYLARHMDLEIETGEKDIHFKEIRDQLLKELIEKKRTLKAREKAAAAAPFGLTSDRLTAFLEESLIDDARFVLPETQEKAGLFMKSAQEKNMPLLFIIKDDLPGSLHNAVRRQLNNADLSDTMIIRESEFIKRQTEFTRHFVFYMGTIEPEIHTAIKALHNKIVLLLGTDTAGYGLATIRAEFLRLYNRGRGLKSGIWCGGCHTNLR